MRIALYGGSFDPPHNGHVAVARAAADAFSLDRVLFAPVGHQPLKQQGASASFVQRLQMIELLAGLDSRFEASRLEAPRADGRPNFTIDTLSFLRTTLPEADHLFVLVGVDAFAELRRWREPDQLLEIAEWIVVSRPGLDVKSVVPTVVPSELRCEVHALESVHVSVSATELRQRLRMGESCEGMLPAAVLRYIEEHKLYGQGDTANTRDDGVGALG